MEPPLGWRMGWISCRCSGEEWADGTGVGMEKIWFGGEACTLVQRTSRFAHQGRMASRSVCVQQPPVAVPPNPAQPCAPLPTGPHCRPPNKDKRLAGLHFVGASTRPGNGVPLCFIGAKLTAERVLKDLGVAQA